MKLTKKKKIKYWKYFRRIFISPLNSVTACRNYFYLDYLSFRKFLGKGVVSLLGEPVSLLIVSETEDLNPSLAP